jgi:hypothetical protein
MRAMPDARARGERSGFGAVVAALAVAACLAAAPAAADDQAAANRLFVRAVETWNAALATGEDVAGLERRAAKLDAVQTTLETIVRRHAGADLAVRLVIGERVGPLSLPEVAAARTAARAALARERCFAAPTARCLLALALPIARGIADAHWRSIALRDIAVDLAEARQTDEALAAVRGIVEARGIADAFDRASALSEIAAALAEAGQTDEALALARGIEGAGDRSSALRAIAAALAAAGQTDEALALARGIEFPSDQVAALTAIARALPAQR